jgi:hypothetical protein
MTSGIYVPQTVPTPAGWQITTWRPRLVLRTQPATGGTMTATADQVPGGQMWRIERAVCASTSTFATSLRLYDVAGDVPCSGTDTGNYDEAEYPNGLLIDQGLQLSAVWTGASDR